MWKLHRYYLREAAVNTVITFTVLFGLALVSLLYKALALLKGGGLLDAISTTLLLAIDIFPHLMNSSLMFATVLTYARASQDREITAARAVGISPRVLMVPALHLGLACSAMATWALHYEVPHAHYERYRILASVYKGKIDLMLRQQDHFEFDKGGMMTWRRKGREDGHEVYYDASIFSDSKRMSALLSVTPGKEGTFLTAQKVWFESDPVTGELSMSAEHLYMPASGFSLERLSFTLDPRTLSGERGHSVDVQDLRSDILLSEVERDAQPDPVLARYTVHRRACFALMPFLLAPIGFCIGMLSRDRGRVAAMSFCLVPIATVYLVDFLSESAVRQTGQPWVGWLSAGIVVITGAPFCWRCLKI